MKTSILIVSALSIFLLIDCNKSNNTINHINCDGLISDSLSINDSGRIYMPNAFTPNSDGLNDICRPLAQNISSIVFTLYDENNTVVFNTNELGQGWRPLADPNTSVKYYYKIQAVTTSNHKIGKCGEVYKLRCLPHGMQMNSLYFEDQLTPSGFTGATVEVLPNCN
jgi:hypothetical protein